MTTQQIKNEIYSFYGLHKRTKITLLEDNKFSVKLGDTELELPYPKSVIRDIKIEKLLNG